MDPKQYKEYVDHMTDIEARRLVGEKNGIADTLMAQSRLEAVIVIHAQKIAELTKLLEESRTNLTKASINAAEHRQKVLDIYMPKVLSKEEVDGQS